MNTLNVRLFLAVLTALVLTIIPLPELLTGFRPPWVLIFVLYIQFYLPEYFNLASLFILGLCLDVLLSTAIGEHAFALTFVTLLASGKARRFNFFSMGQQMGLVAALWAIYLSIIYVLDAFMGYSNHWWMVLGTTLISLFFWPCARVLAESTLCYDSRL